MYEQHYGFKRRPFRSVATGGDVFVGPQTARIIQATKLALATPDAVVAVMGPAGTGKTTIINRALNAIDVEKHIIRITRMQLGHDEVLDFLLDELQAQDVPASTIRKVTMFRRLLAERTTSGVRVIVVLEDAVRIGDDALAEVEALTAADGLGNEGAAVVMMGEMQLRDRLDGEALTRLKQRIRAYQFVSPFALPELRGYLKHCFRLGGGELDRLFDAQGVAFIHALTDGNPRSANNVVEAVLTAAAIRKVPKIDNHLIAAIAENEFGLTAAFPEPDAAPAAAPPESAPGPASSTAPTNAGEASAAADIAVAPAASAIDAETTQPDPTAPPTVPDAETAADAVAETIAGDEIPELVNATVPELAVLETDVTAEDDEHIESAGSAAQDDEPAADANDSMVEYRIPTLIGTSREPVLDANAGLVRPDTADPEPELRTDGTPGPERAHERPAAANDEQSPGGELFPVPGDDPLKDPTIAELTPDFDVLEEAMAGLANDDDGAEVVAVVAPKEVALRAPANPGLPTITLDAAIQEDIAEATAALEMHDATMGDDTVAESAAAVPQTPADEMSETDIKKIASGIRKAHSLADVDEKMAETLFGAEFNAVAARVIASRPPIENTSRQPSLGMLPDAPAQGPEEMQPLADVSLAEDRSAAEPKDQRATTGGTAAPGKPASAMEKEFLEIHGGNALEVSLESDKPNPGMDMSASQRLATVRALNAAQVPKAALPPKPAPQSAAGDSTPQSIEEQITTSMTATLRALSVRTDSANDEDDDEEEAPKRGFFSRFRRS